MNIYCLWECDAVLCFIYSNLYNTDSVKAALVLNRKIVLQQFIVYSVMSSSSSVQFFSNNVCAIKPTILLEMKRPQLRKPKATVVRNGKNGLSRGASSPLARRNQHGVFNSRLQHKSDCGEKSLSSCKGLFLKKNRHRRLMMINNSFFLFFFLVEFDKFSPLLANLLLKLDVKLCYSLYKFHYAKWNVEILV